MDSKKSVWVIDDEANGFEVIELLLRREGYSLTYISNGKDTLSRLEVSLPDVILLDVMMPEMDGIEVCRRIKANPNWKPIPVIMVTALDSKEDLARSLESGADDFLTKPVNGLELRARVRSMLRIKHQYDALQATVTLRRDLSKLVVEDLRQPMSTVLLGSHLLLQSNLEPKDREQAERVYAAGQAIDGVINGLLQLAKMEAGKLVLNRVELDLSELAEVVVANFQAIAAAKHVQLSCKFPEQRRWISADANLLHRLLDALISNAIQASAAGSTIALQIDHPTPPDFLGQGIIRIFDQRESSGKELQQAILDHYKPGSLSSGASPVGLNLTFCKLVAEAHGGSISIADNHPQGSIVTVAI